MVKVILDGNPKEIAAPMQETQERRRGGINRAAFLFARKQDYQRWPVGWLAGFGRLQA